MESTVNEEEQGDVTDKEHASISRSFLPFSKGPRSCIGQGMILQRDTRARWLLYMCMFTECVECACRDIDFVESNDIVFFTSSLKFPHVDIFHA